MIINPKIPLHRLILSLSEALDHVRPEIMEHQQRVAYIATMMGRHMGLSHNDLLDVFEASALHDIGIIGTQRKFRALIWGELEAISEHGEMGYELLKDNPFFARSGEIVRFHHAEWHHGAGCEDRGCAVPFASHIVALADIVEVSINREVDILQQRAEITERIRSGSGDFFHPDCVEAFLDVSQPESFWLDVTGSRIYSTLLRQVDWPVISIDEVTIGPIAEIFARIVDCASQWTMFHTAGVASTAVALARNMNFSSREISLMRAAGYLHDLGKLTVSTDILDKPSRLSPEEMAVMKGHTYHTFRILDTIGGLPQIAEWAAFHHERIDGRGYPFRHCGDDLTLGSRIMAVADVFTAVAEDRPYRKGMSEIQAMDVLDKLAANGGLDGDVVAVLKRDYDLMDGIRRDEQRQYHDKQVRLMSILENSLQRN